MKKQIVLWSLIAALMLLNGCSFLASLLDVIPGVGSDDKDDNDGIQSPYAQPEIFCTYFHYFQAGPRRYDQWWIQGKDPKRVIGPESWRRDIWVGRAGDYPYIGIYNNVSDAEIMRWHIRLAKASGITAFLLYVNDWQKERAQTDLLLEVAKQENFKIGFVEHHSFLGARSIQRIGGRYQPMLPSKYVGYEEITEQLSRDLGISLPLPRTQYRRPIPRTLRNVSPDAINRAAKRITDMVKRWKSHPAYLRIDGKPIIVIPYMVAELTASEFRHLLHMVTSGVGEELYVVAVVPPVYWYFAPGAIFGTGITQEWAETGVSSFTHWTPNGMVTAPQSTRLKVTRFNVKDSLKWKKDAMIPIMPGFEDDAWRPGPVPAPTAPRNNGKAWKEQIDAAFAAKPRFIFIQAWNEWHEGSQIEPSTHYSDPYLYLKILAQRLKKPWQRPPLPPQDRIDRLRRPFL